MNPRRVVLAAAGSLAGLAAAVALLVGSGGAPAPAPGAEFMLPAPLPAPDFELTDHTGAPVRLSALGEGRALVLFFGYTHCPDVCPITMAALGRARTLLGEDAEWVVGALVTVDPARDDPATLAAYLAQFPPGLVGLTGPEATLTEAAAAYLAHAERAPAPAHEHGAEGADGYLIDHTARAFVVQDGSMRMTFPPGTGAPEMAAGLKLLLDR